VKDYPLVSVVMPCYNGRRYVEQAIGSILDQTYENLELIVVNDSSTDGSREIIKRCLRTRDILIDHATNEGRCRSLNDGIRAARGEFIARMDADDISDRWRIEKQVEIMRSDKDLAVCGTHVQGIDNEGNFLFYQAFPIEDEEIRSLLPITFPMSSGAQIWRRDKLFQVGLFDDRIPGAEDLELTLRLCQVGKLRNIPLPLYYWRRAFSSGSNISELSQIERIMLARKAFILKNSGDLGKLEKHYQIFASHYQNTKFSKVHIPEKNKAHYYRNLALINLINKDKNIAKIYFDKAKNIDSKSLANIFITILIKSPQLLTDSIYCMNKLIKMFIYYILCGNIKRYLKRSHESF
jgi:glycosyltransferase involved in cell wall biosynthesis